MTFTRSAKAAAIFARLHPPGSEEEAIVLATAKGQSAHSVAPELRTVAAWASARSCARHSARWRWCRWVASD